MIYQLRNPLWLSKDWGVVQSGVIINTLMGEEIYDVNNEKSILDWNHKIIEMTD